MDDMNPNAFHFKMLQKYHTLFQMIETESLDLDQLRSLVKVLDRTEHLSDEEIQIHQSLLKKLEKFSEEIKTHHWMSRHLKVLHEMGQAFSQTFDKEQIYSKAYELVSQVMDTDAFIIALYQEGETAFSIPFCIDNGVRYENRTVPLGQGIISKVIQTKETLHLKTSSEVIEQRNFVQWGNIEQPTETCMFVPMILNSKMLGVISVQNYREFAYRTEHEELLRIVGIQVASAIETANLYDKVYEMSVRDELTNLKNSRKFHQDLEKRIKNAVQGETISLMMLDSDNLKQINDLYGHHIGDKMIQYISKALQQHLDEDEEAYRYAGDEFMLISPESDVEHMVNKAKKIQNDLKKHPLVHNDILISTTISVGIAQFPHDTGIADELKRLADQAMYKSKKNGKNQVTVFQIQSS